MQAIFFDADGVIYYRQHPHQHLNNFLQRHRLPVLDREAIWRATYDARIQASCGVMEEEAWFQTVLGACQVTDPILRREGCQAMAADAADITLFEGVVETLQALKVRGLRLGIITNTTATTAEKLRWLHERGLALQWDAFANSRDVGARKPDPGIYEAALKQCAVRADQAIFVGHSVKDLAGARDVGMVTVAVKADPDAQADYFVHQFSGLLDLSILQTLP